LVGGQACRWQAVVDGMAGKAGIVFVAREVFFLSAATVRLPTIRTADTHNMKAEIHRIAVMHLSPIDSRR